jgi:hypothetical protein
MRKRPRAIVGMNPGEPLFMRFAGGLRRKAMDQEILGRATVSKPIPEVDFDPADPANALDPGKFGFSFPERLKGLIALS